MDLLRLQSAVAQHHDGISGTARKIVVNDYIDRLEVGMDAVKKNLIPVIESITTGQSMPELSLDENSLFSTLNSGKTGVVVVYNSLERQRTDFIKLNIPNVLVNVLSANNSNIPAQIDPNLSHSNQAHLFFQVTVPALGYATYFIQPSQNSSYTEKGVVTTVSNSNSNSSISNNFYQLKYVNGSLNQITNNNLGQIFTINQTLMQYEVSDNPNQPGGAYIFRNKDNKDATPIANPAFIGQQIVGPLVQSFHQLWNLTVRVDTETVQTNATTVISFSFQISINYN